MEIVSYTTPKTVGDFMLSNAFFRVIMGPVGSGKTTGCIFEVLKRAMEQAPGRDGVRRTRFAIVRTTLSQLKMTVLLDVLAWLRPIASYKVSEQLITIEFDDVYSEWFMIPLEEEEDQKRLLSMQLTGAWLNEAIETSPDLIGAISGRCGRFPSRAEGGPTWFGLIGDTNAPIEGSDWHKLMEDDRPADWVIFRQPSGLSIEAENLDNLPGGRLYYERLAQNPNKDFVRRYVDAEYGEDPSGTAVFRESFKRSFHTVDEVTPVPGQLVLVGQDFGRHPCSLICQPDHKGRLLVLEEVIAEDIGLETHVSRSLKPKLMQARYADLKIAAVGDPSGLARGPFLEEDSFDVLRRLGVPAFPSTTNDIDARLRAVEAMLFQQRDGGPALVIDRGRCPNLVRALNGAYRYAKTKDGITKPLPEKKNPWSDLCDALEYVCLVYNAGIAVYIAKKLRPKPKRSKEDRKMPAAGWT
jgi:hypothetical protein